MENKVYLVRQDQKDVLDVLNDLVSFELDGHSIIAVSEYENRFCIVLLDEDENITDDLDNAELSENVYFQDLANYGYTPDDIQKILGEPTRIFDAPEDLFSELSM